tara:strand:- start:1586 stop:1840 length:255 start_codon:yes stop_codon:yes gene_type:complete
MSYFKEAKTVGELKALISNLPDDTKLLMGNNSGGGYRKKIWVLNINNSNEQFDFLLYKIKSYQCLEDKIKGTYNNLKDIVIFGC